MAATQLKALALALVRGDDAQPGPLNTAGLQHLSRLTYLGLDFCRLTTLPAQVALLPLPAMLSAKTI